MQELWTVSALTRYIRGLFDADYRLQDLWVEGEVSNLSRPASGHLYFTLKEDRKSTRLNSSHSDRSRMPSSA